MTRKRVVVIGGGIAGLSAAYELTGGDSADGLLDVTVLEAAPAFGGKLRADTFEGVEVDLGPDGFLARRPEATALARALGLGEELRTPGQMGASVLARGKVRPLPQGLSIGVPTRWRSLRAAKVLSWPALLRAGLDVVAPRHDLRGPLGDRAIGPLVAQKLGQQVVDVLVDPMLGGIHAGRVADMSAASVFPPLLEAAGQPGSLMHALRRAMPAPPPPAEGAAPSPVFYALNGGMTTLVDRLVEVLTARGVELRTDAPVTELTRTDLGGIAWTLSLNGELLGADAVILATPAPQAAALLEPIEPDVAGLLHQVDYASVALVTFSFDDDALPGDLFGTGLLIPATSTRRGGGSFLATAVTYLSAKWPHVKVPGRSFIRVSAGRIDDHRIDELNDQELAAALGDELDELLALSSAPHAVRVQRWHDALPQYRVNHQLKVAGIEAGVHRLPGLEVAGAAYDGVGIPACIGSGRRSGRLAAASLGVRPALPEDLR